MEILLILRYQHITTQVKQYLTRNHDIVNMTISNSKHTFTNYRCNCACNVHANSVTHTQKFMHCIQGLFQKVRAWDNFSEGQRNVEKGKNI